MKAIKILGCALLVSFCINVNAQEQKVTSPANMDQMLASLVSELQNKLVGKKAPNFITKDVNGRKLSLESFKGKYVILDFWATWCKPCRQSHPHLISLYKKYHDKGLEIIGIADDDPRPEAWREAIAADNITMFHHALAGSDPKKRMKGEENPADIMAMYSVPALPTKFVIDKAGKVVAAYVGDSDKIDGKLKELFGF
ncbi:TlpA family protein disulfide reductase [Pedobacter faecalis]|uniref:TlpA family protein disulfide reductase n=1 Tax=Pedobacter faecalis TaxID=3041495 RepID=UPI00254D3D6E|nr:TlpA disulfide reductase family protein [Pedobacter sp. ELA7]